MGPRSLRFQSCRRHASSEAAYIHRGQDWQSRREHISFGYDGLASTQFRKRFPKDVDGVISPENMSSSFRAEDVL